MVFGSLLGLRINCFHSCSWVTDETSVRITNAFTNMAGDEWVGG